MKFRFATIAAFVATAVMILGIPAAPSDAQEPDVLVNAIALTDAQAVVNGDVVAIRVVSIDTMPHTVAKIAVDETVEGTTGDVIHVVVPGGTLADGTRVSVSHTASFRVGDEVQIAVTEAPDDVLSTIASETGINPSVIFGVSGGDEGVAALDGHDLHSDFHGASDYEFNGARWADFVPAARYHVNPSGSGVSSTATVNAIKRAAAAWENDPQSSIDFTFAGTTSRAGVDMNDGQNTLSFQNKGNEGYLAVAYWMPSGNGQYSFDIIFNTRYTFGDRSGSGNWYNIESTALHELGHVLGLGHTRATSEVMSSTIMSGTTPGLGQGDRNGVRSLYRAAAGPLCGGKVVTVNLQTGQGSPTSGADVILGTSGRDTINGGGGSDTICGEGGNDKIDGGAGNDVIFGGDGHDDLSGGWGNDTINGGDGSDTMYGEQGADSISGGNGDDRIFGQGSNDNLAGGAGADAIRGGVGNDTMSGGDGEDLMFGNAGSDTMDGGKHADRLRGQASADQLYGSDGNDLVVGGGGADTHHGGPGSDRCVEGASQGFKEAYISCES